MRTRERALSLLLIVPGLLLFSGFTAIFVFVAVRALSNADPDGLLPLLSVVATLVGVFWAMSPLVSGLALSEAHDLSRLLHFPVPLRTLALSSLLANLSQPLVLAEIPIVVAVAAALAGTPGGMLLTVPAVGLSFVLMVATGQLVGLLLHGAARRRRLNDLAIFLGLAFGFVMSLLPVLLLSGGMGFAGPGLAAAIRSDLLALSPWSWGVRAAAHAGQGQLAAAAVYALGAVAALLAVGAASAALIGRVYRGELAVGPDPTDSAPARMIFDGALGALVEKDLRSGWRDPALKASLFIGLLGPLIVVTILSRSAGQDGSGAPLLLLALFLGASGFGANALGLERRGISLLLSMPVERWRILAAKNAAAIVMRVPGLLTLAVATVLLAPPVLLPATLTVALVVLVCSAAVDNFASVLFPVPLPDAGRNPWSGPSAGSRGLGGAMMSMLLMTAGVVIAAPFVFLAWLPAMLQQPVLWLGCLPLALAGSLSVYAMLVVAAGNLLQRREPDVLERMLGEA